MIWYSYYWPTTTRCYVRGSISYVLFATICVHRTHLQFLLACSGGGLCVCYCLPQSRGYRIWTNLMTIRISYLIEYHYILRMQLFFTKKGLRQVLYDTPASIFEKMLPHIRIIRISNIWDALILQKSWTSLFPCMSHTWIYCWAFVR